MNKLQQLAISESGFIFDPMTGSSYTSNETAIFLMRTINQNSDMASIVESLVNEFEVSADQAERDVQSFLSELERFHLLDVGVVK